MTHRQLLAAAKGESMIAITIRKAVKDQAPLTDILDYVRSQAADNPKMMAGVIGEKLTRKLLQPC